MSKKKFRQGKQITSVEELLKHDWFIVYYGGGSVRKTVNKGFILSWQLKLCERFVGAGAVFVAERLTNGEYYSNLTDEQVGAKLGDDLCNYCPLPDDLKGVHNYGNGPVMCEGSHCQQAIKAWKEEPVE